MTIEPIDYLFAEPKSASIRATVFLIHGWPDLSFGWRYQIPALVKLGLRVVAPDMMGYGGTDAPQVSEDKLEPYSMKRASDDIAELARQLGVDRIIIGGHDWGGFVVYRCALWHPELISHGMSISYALSGIRANKMERNDCVCQAILHCIAHLDSN